MGIIAEDWSGTIAIENDGGCIEFPADFAVTGDYGPAELTSWGASRGYEVEAKAELRVAHMGEFEAARWTVEDMIGKESLVAQEESAAQAFEAYFRARLAA